MNTSRAGDCGGIVERPAGFTPWPCVTWVISAPLADPANHQEKDNHPDEPGHPALGHRSEVPEGVASPVFGVIEVGDVGNDGLKVAVAERRQSESGHVARTDAHGFGDLGGCGPVTVR